jgi:hypothetical protein
MKSFCTTGLLLFATVGWTASPAHAQSKPSAPELLPLPSVAPVDTSSVAATYYANPAILEQYGPSFANLRQDPPAPSPVPVPGPTEQGRTEFEQAMHDTGWDDSRCCEDPRCGKWFGALGGLVMGRTRANPYWTTVDSNNNSNQLLNTQDAGARWTGGGQVTAGYAFGGRGGSCGSCGCGGLGYLGPGLAFTYWGLGPMTAVTTLTDPNNNLSTPINLNSQSGPVLIGNQPADHFFDNSHIQRISRDDRINSFELNLLQGGWTAGRLQMAAIAGFRYFRFDERLAFGAAAANTNFFDNNGADEAYLKFRCSNNLFGGQFGALLNYNVTDSFSIFVVPKAGIYGNQMNCRTLLYSGDGQLGFDIGSHKSDVAFLGELDSGFSYAFGQNWRAFIGYRVVSVANVALADNQFLPSLADSSGFAQVKQNGTVILHGVMIGAGWAF